MPVIRQYGDARVNVPGPVSRPQYSADQFGAAEGQAMQNLGTSVQQVARTVANRLDQENTSEITNQVTKANAELSVELQQTIRKADPGDKKVFEDFEQKVDDTLSKIGENANTEGARSFFGEASAKIKSQLYKTSMDGQAELAGIKAVNDYQQTLNSLSAASMADPSAMQLQRDLHKQAIENLVSTGQLPREKAIELERSGNAAISKATIRGWAKLNPEYARGKLESGDFDKDLGGDGKAQMFGEIDQAVRAKEIEAERRRQEQERIVKEQQKLTQQKLLQGLVDKKLTTDDIMSSNLDAFGSGSKEQFLNLLDKANSPEERLKTDSGVFIDLFNRINLPEDDPRKIRDENDLNKYVGNGLSFPDLNRLRDEMQGKNTQTGGIENDLKKQLIEIARGKLTKSNPLMGVRDPIGDENLQRYMIFFLDEYKERRAKGDTAVELLSPDSPKYLGKMIDQYVRTPQEIMKDMVRRKTVPKMPEIGEVRKGYRFKGGDPNKPESWEPAE